MHERFTIELEPDVGYFEIVYFINDAPIHRKVHESFAAIEGVPSTHGTPVITVIGDLNIDELVISVHGMTPDDYKTVHNQDAFELVVGNINTLLKVQNDLGIHKPAIVVQSAKMDTNIQNFDRIYSLFSRPVRHSITLCGYNPHVHTEDHRIRKYSYIRDVPCHSLYQLLAVSWDGQITVCCGDINFDLAVGRIEDRLHQAWQSEKIWQLRKMHRSGIFPAVCRGCVDPVTYSREHL